MDVYLNLIPRELRAKPLVDRKTLASIVLIMALVICCGLLFYARTDTQNENASLEDDIAAMRQQALSLSTNAEAVQLTQSIAQLKALKQGYDSFVASQVLWGAALQRVYVLSPTGVTIKTIKQASSTLTITGTAPSYTQLSAYARALDNDTKLDLVGLPSYSDGTFSLAVKVTPGGAP